MSHFYEEIFSAKLDKYALTWLDVWNCYNSYVLLIGQSIVDLFLIWLSYKPRCSEKLIRWRSIGEGLSEFHHFCFGFCSFVVHGSCFVFLAVYLLLSSYYIYYPWLNELVVFGWKSFIYLFIFCYFLCLLETFPYDELFEEYLGSFEIDSQLHESYLSSR